MKRPYMKLFPSDWRGDPRLRVCSIGARGLWFEMICIMHEADPYGSLVVNGVPVDEKQLAALAGIPQREAKTHLSELRAAGVFSEDNGIIFSRRMRRDAAKAARDKANGERGGNPTLKAGVNPQVNGQDKAHSPYSIVHNKQEEDRHSGKEKWKPRHGTVSKRKGTIFLVEGTRDFQEYDADHFNATGKHAIADTPAEGGGMGKWFKVAGSMAIPPPQRIMRAARG